MAKHKIVLAVELTMDEMDGTTEQSAEIALDLVTEAIAKHWDAEAEVAVINSREVF
jgi:hypothetical protein